MIMLAKHERYIVKKGNLFLVGCPYNDQSYVRMSNHKYDGYQMKDFNEELVREFSEELTRKILSKIYIGWQEVTQEYNRMEGEVALLAANPKYDSLNLDIDGELGKTLMKSILRNFSLN